MNIFSHYFLPALAAMLLATTSFAQNNTRPNVVVPNGFEVNSYTGNLYHARNDLKVRGQGLNIDLTFSYNVSRRAKNWGFGPGWTFSYNMAWVSDSLGVWVERPDGRRDLFRKSGNRYTAQASVHDSLTEYQKDRFLLRTKDGLNYYFDNPQNRRLTKIEDPNKNWISLSYADSLITGLSDGTGHSFSFKWTGGKLEEITDHSCEPVRKVAYSYDERGNPVKVTNPAGDFVTYYYDKESKIVGYTDEMGNSMSVLYNFRMGVQKITSCATTHTFSYVPLQFKTFVTEKVSGSNVITTYQFDTLGRVINKKGNCCGYNVDYSYDARDNVTERRDGMGRGTAYEYDSRGNVTRETFADGTSNGYTYDEKFNRLTSLTDRMGNSTTYEYNAEGRLIRTEKPLGVTESHEYDGKGNMLSFTDARGNTTRYSYNTMGYQTSVTDAAGNSARNTYDCHGNRLTASDAAGNTTSYEYDLLDRLVKLTDAVGGVTAYTYDKKGNLTSVTNAAGKTTRYLYDGLDRRIATQLPGGSSTVTAYDEMGNVSKTTDGRGYSTAYTYNSRRQVLTETDALGNTIGYEYDEAGNRTSLTDKKGNTTRMEYDEAYRLARVTNAAGATVSYSYDALGNRIAEIDANGNVTQYEYDALQRLVKVRDALGKSVSYTYDGNGNRLTETDKNGNTITYTYDKLNRVLSVENPDGATTSFTYDAVGNILTEKDPLGHQSVKTYDKLNRLLTDKNPLGEVTKYTYETTGNIATLTLPGGNVTTNSYDDDGRLLKVTDEKGVVAAYAYDAGGNRVTEADGNGNTVTFTYDALGRQTGQTDALGRSSTHVFDANNNILSETDRNGNIRRYSYDAQNRRISETDAAGSVTKFTYDANGNRTGIIDAKGNSTQYFYNALNLLTRETYADGSSKEYTYDGNGNRLSRRDHAGVTTSYVYDKVNRLLRRSYPGGKEDRFTYDAAGRRLTAENANASVSFTYDDSGRLLSETLNGKKTGYVYNTDAGTKTITYPGGRKVTETRDLRDRLTEVKDASQSLASFVYDNGNRLIEKKFGNGYREDYSYNANNWLTSLACGPSGVIGLKYTYDYEGNRLSVLKEHRPEYSEKYTYDNLYRLTGFYTGKLVGAVLSDTASRSVYRYDALHNRIVSVEDGVKRSYVANVMNAYTSVTTGSETVAWTYDANGNTTYDGSKRYAYDEENRLVKVDEGAAAEHFYDALGRRIKTVTPSQTTNYYFDGNRFIEERDGNDAVRKTYVYGVWLDDIISYNLAGKDYYLLNTPQGNVLAALDANGVVERYEYSGYGEMKFYSGTYSGIEGSGIGNVHGFTGRPYLGYQRGYDFRSRVYGGGIGRFSQRDVAGYIDGLNLYQAYFVPDHIDPYGRNECKNGMKLCQKSKPVANGCGSSEHWKTIFGKEFTSEWVPEYFFNDACNGHDLCWGRCGSDRNYCNVEFLTRMVRTCNRIGSIIPGLPGSSCYSIALLYYTAVGIAVDTFKEVQANACECSCDCNNPITSDPTYQADFNSISEVKKHYNVTVDDLFGSLPRGF